MFFRNLVVGLVFAVFSLVALAVPGRPGTLDFTFGTNGTWSSSLLDSVPYGALQSTGKLVLVGRCDGYLTSAFIDSFSVICGTRATQDGQADTSFSLRYQVVEQISDPITGLPTTRIRFTSPSGMGVQQDDKILVVGDCYVSKCVLRFFPDGPLDAGFGAGGIRTAPFAATAIQVGPDGRMLIAGRCAAGICLMRLLHDGTSDTSFGSAGSSVISVPPLPPSSGGTHVRLGFYSDGRIVVGASCLVGVDLDFCGFRLLADGTLDNTFGASGQFQATIGAANDYVNALLVTADDKVILAGSCEILSAGPLTQTTQCALRVKGDGSLDQCFGAPDRNSNTCTGAGAVSLVPAGYVSAGTLAVSIESGAKILLAGYCTLAGTFGGDRACISRLSPSGVLDLSFGDEGFAIIEQAPANFWPSAASSLFMASASTAVIGAACGNPNYIAAYSGFFCAARFDVGSASTCSLDLDGDGLVLPLTDGLINLRVASGFTGAAVLDGINFPASATRRTWPVIRDFMVKSCGLSIPK